MLLLSTPHGANYIINDNGDIERLDLKGFRPSGQWKMLGLQHVRRSYFIPLKRIADTIQSLDLTYKNGKPQYTVRDLDHGTTREWGNTEHHGVRSIRALSESDANFLRDQRDRSAS